VNSAPKTATAKEKDEKDKERLRSKVRAKGEGGVDTGGDDPAGGDCSP
jgi:hypothetical protein